MAFLSTFIRRVPNLYTILNFIKKERQGRKKSTNQSSSWHTDYIPTSLHQCTHYLLAKSSSLFKKNTTNRRKKRFPATDSNKTNSRTAERRDRDLSRIRGIPFLKGSWQGWFSIATHRHSGRQRRGPWNVLLHGWIPRIQPNFAWWRRSGKDSLNYTLGYLLLSSHALWTQECWGNLPKGHDHALPWHGTLWDGSLCRWYDCKISKERRLSGESCKSV